jgi:hypothetical protein
MSEIKKLDESVQNSPHPAWLQDPSFEVEARATVNNIRSDGTYFSTHHRKTSPVSISTWSTNLTRTVFFSTRIDRTQTSLGKDSADCHDSGPYGFPKQQQDQE